MTSRRAFLLGLGAVLAAPAIIRTPGLLMPVRKLAVPQMEYLDLGNGAGLEYIPPKMLTEQTLVEAMDQVYLYLMRAEMLRSLLPGLSPVHKQTPNRWEEVFSAGAASRAV